MAVSLIGVGGNYSVMGRQETFGQFLNNFPYVLRGRNTVQMIRQGASSDVDLNVTEL